MLARVEAEFGARVALEALFKYPTIESFALSLEDDTELESDFTKIVRLYPESGQQQQIFGINGTGAFHLLAKLLGPKLPLTSLQLFPPGAPQELMPDSLERIGADYVKLIRQLQPRGPYSLLGWSIGGLVAFETAQQLAAAGEDVAFLGLIETTPRVRLGWLRSALAANTYRLQFNLGEWAKVASGERSLARFILDRQSVREAARAT